MDWLSFRPLLTNYLVRLAKGLEKTAGGIWLPEETQARHWQGEILAAGPGISVPYARGMRSEMWCLVGESVVFQQQHLEMLDARERIGLVKDEMLLAVAYPDRPSPCNDWVMILPDPIRSHEGLIAVAERYQKRPHSGVVAGVGPGKLLLAGRLRGTRASVYKIMGEALEVGQRVYWDGATEVVQIGRESAEYYLIRASDLIAWEEESACSTDEQEQENCSPAIH
jgi:co-chaperonin GroES (HSP10)